VIYDIKLAGGESVISEALEADRMTIMDGILEFWRGGKCIFYVGVNRLISVRPR
jgi:hypothetical protein